MDSYDTKCILTYKCHLLTDRLVFLLNDHLIKHSSFFIIGHFLLNSRRILPGLTSNGLQPVNVNPCSILLGSDTKWRIIEKRDYLTGKRGEPAACTKEGKLCTIGSDVSLSNIHFFSSVSVHLKVNLENSANSLSLFSTF